MSERLLANTCLGRQQSAIVVVNQNKRKTQYYTKEKKYVAFVVRVSPRTRVNESKV